MKITTVTLNPCIDKTFSVRCMMPERKLLADHMRRYPGGGGINVARAITRLGGEACGLWSRGGSIGDLLQELLDREGIRHRAVPIGGEVRENVIVLDRASDQQYRFGMPGPPLSAGERQSWTECVRDASASSDVLVFSGSLPGDVDADWYGELVGLATQESRVVVDTKGDALRAALQRGVFLIKPNINELKMILGGDLRDDQEIEEAARKLIQEKSAEVVLVSLGAGGALLVTDQIAVHVPSPTVPVRSRVGAGDSMVGGLILALTRDYPLEEAARFAVAAGAAAVMAEGTELCRREDTERLFQQMRRGQAG